MSRLLMAWLLALVLAQIPGGARGECGLAADDLNSLVLRFAPVLVQGPEIPAPPERLLYRAATSPDGRELWLAYHVVWPFEQDPRPGFYPTITRLTYTGGLKLQRVIYGPGDVEVIGIKVDLSTRRATEVTYETADYDRKGNVIHVPVTATGAELPPSEPPVFQVVSWNHMFKLLPASPGSGEPVYRIAPEPFSDELWAYYRMTKKKPGPLSSDRAHYSWELGRFCPAPVPGPGPDKESSRAGAP